MADAHKNFAYSTVATAPSPASSGTSLVIATGDGAKFPAAPFNATVWPVSAQPTTVNAEIVRVTAISTDTLTITRAQESSSARSIIVGDQIAATVTAKTLTDIESVTRLLPSGGNDSSAIQAALATGAALLGPGTFQIGTPLTIDSYQSLIGSGRATKLVAANGLNADLISLATTGTEWVTIGGLAIDGNYANNSSGNAITFNNNWPGAAQPPPFTLTDSHHRLYDLLIYHTAGDGIHFVGAANKGPRTAILDRVFVYKINGVGFSIQGSDSLLVNCESGHTGLQGFVIGPFGANTQLSNCKAFGAGDISTGYGFDITSSDTQMSNCSAQNNASHGYHIASDRFIAGNCLADTNGSASVHPVGFDIAGNRVYLSGCHAWDDGSGWQGYGLQIESTMDYIAVTGSTYANVSGSLNNLSAGTHIDTTQLKAW